MPADNVRDKWHPDVSAASVGAPLLLVGTKSDLREDKAVVAALAKRKREPVTYAQGVELARLISGKGRRRRRATHLFIRRQLGAAAYMECSAKTQEGLKDLFAEAAKIALDGQDKKGRARGSGGGGAGRRRQGGVLGGRCQIL